MSEKTTLENKTKTQAKMSPEDNNIYLKRCSGVLVECVWGKNFKYPGLQIVNSIYIQQEKDKADVFNLLINLETKDEAGKNGFIKGKILRTGALRQKGMMLALYFLIELGNTILKITTIS